MRKLLFLFLLTLSTTQCFAQLYTKAFGEPTNPAIIFLHGGPGYNCVNFELTTAQKLADKGFYVIVYDQRGCARSKEIKDSKFTMEEAIADLKSVYDKYKLKKAILIGHSWGGTLGTCYAAEEPKMVDRVILVGSPYSYPMTLSSIVRNSERSYKAKDDTASLKFIAYLRTKDTTSLEYSSMAFMQAMRAGLYMVKQPTEESKALGAMLRESPEAKYLRMSEYPPVQGLYTNEHYTSFVIDEWMNKAKSKGVAFYGIYGDEDGLFDGAQLDILCKELGTGHFKIVKGASHNVFIDQQPIFLQTVVEYSK